MNVPKAPPDLCVKQAAGSPVLMRQRQPVLAEDNPHVSRLHCRYTEVSEMPYSETGHEKLIQG